VIGSAPRLILGLSSGTSADALDVALVEIVGTGRNRKVKCLVGDEFETPLSLKRRITNFLKTYDLPLRDLEKAISLFFVESAQSFLMTHNVSAADLTCVASHGQTVFHHNGDPRQGSLQLGNLQFLADQLNVAVVGDFRQADLLAGGQGAPISVFADWVLHSDKTDLAIVNIGGIANISYLRDNNSPPLAWDSGPGNGLLDAVSRIYLNQEYDVGGHVALSADFCPVLLEDLQKHPYFSLKAPKSTGLELFGPKFIKNLRLERYELSVSEILATLCQLSAWGISSSLIREAREPKTLYLCGGGRKNLALVGALSRQLPNTEILDYEKSGFDADLREAVAFALLGDAYLLGETSTWPTTTGARKSVILGEGRAPMA
jgi:anhydro-N-acetylmuramic acid kinase